MQTRFSGAVFVWHSGRPRINPKPEIRNPREARSPKPKTSKPNRSLNFAPPAGSGGKRLNVCLRNSEIGYLSDFGLRISDRFHFVKSVFFMNAAAHKHLAVNDPVMRRLIRDFGPCELVPETRRSPFQSLVLAVAHQQLHATAANAILARFKKLFPGRRFPRPEDLSSVYRR